MNLAQQLIDTFAGIERNVILEMEIGDDTKIGHAA
jgi:hypothetical protein